MVSVYGYARQIDTYNEFCLKIRITYRLFILIENYYYRLLNIALHINSV